MRLDDHFRHSGALLFRWRSFILLAFLPVILWVATDGERIEMLLGDRFGDAFEVFALLVVALGCLGRILTVGFVPPRTSGRNTGEGQIAETLNTTGAYSLVRNPLYLANSLIYVGIALFSQNLVVALILALVLVPYYERIIAAEERFLATRFGATYDRWANQTPAFWPRLTGFVPPALAFSARHAIRREHATVYGAIVALFLVEAVLHAVPDAAEPLETSWLVLLGLATLAEAVILTLKRRTKLLSARR